MIYKRIYEHGEYIMEILEESAVWPNGDPIPDEKIVVFLSRKPNQTYASKLQDQPPHQPTNP